MVVDNFDPSMICVFGYYISKVYLFLVFWEAALFFVSLYAGVYLRFDVISAAHGDLNPFHLIITSLLFALVMSASMIALGLYQRGVQERTARLIVRMGLGFLLGTVALSLLFYAFPPIFVGRGVLALSLLIAFLGVMITRAAFDRLATDDSRKRRVLILGTGVNAQRIHQLLENDPSVGFLAAGYVPLYDTQPLIPAHKQIEKCGSLLDMAIDQEVDEVVVAVDDRRRKLPVDEILDCKMSGFQVLDLLSFFEKENASIQIDLLHPGWIIFSNDFQIGLAGLYGKRIIDLLMSLLLLIIFTPIMLLVVITSKLESRGKLPVLFHQVRVGQNGRLFRLYKFRSMRMDAEADGVARWATQNDVRVTPFGGLIRKTRLDELPQLFNVVKGQMSLVGPRPERPEFVEQLAKTIPFYSERHRVKPGVTGWAQVLYPYGANEEDAKRKLEYDLYYVKHAGVFMDMVILLQTVEVVLLGKGGR